MIIKSIFIKRFRGFKDVSFALGKNITIISGQNGTQKTTVLGLLSQPFSLSKDSPMSGEKPICGMNYRSAFQEKFQLSDVFDKPGTHEWTLYFDLPEVSEFTVESIVRSNSALPRFWQKGTRTKGSGYIQLPVIYLSLSRLHPIGEDNNLKSSNRINLTNDEIVLLENWHNEILILTKNDLKSVDYLESDKKNTLGFNTSVYDWRMNSAGQDNLSKILLSILSFKRLKERYPDDYKGGILAIDELDATMYPASQLKLLEHLIRFSTHYCIQIVVTSHSIPLIENACSLQDNSTRMGQVRVVHMHKEDTEIKVKENATFPYIKSRLNVALQVSHNKRRKLYAYTEDPEAEMFLKCILKTSIKQSLKFQKVIMGCGNYMQLAEKKIPCFTPDEAMIFLDGDLVTKGKDLKRAQRLKNVIILPGSDSPERILATYLYNLPESSSIWQQILSDYRHEICFKEYPYSDIMNDRIVAKKWFTEQKQHWGRGGAKLINLWIKDNKTAVDTFKEEVKQYIEKYC